MNIRFAKNKQADLEYYNTSAIRSVGQITQSSALTALLLTLGFLFLRVLSGENVDSSNEVVIYLGLFTASTLLFTAIGLAERKYSRKKLSDK